jgi:hypothetical protein
MELEPEEYSLDSTEIDIILSAMTAVHYLTKRYKAKEYIQGGGWIIPSRFLIEVKCVLALWFARLREIGIEQTNFVQLIDEMENDDLKSLFKLYYNSLDNDPDYIQNLVDLAKIMPFGPDYMRAKEQHHNFGMPVNDTWLSENYQKFYDNYSKQSNDKWPFVMIDFALKLCRESGLWTMKLKGASENLIEQIKNMLPFDPNTRAKLYADGAINLFMYVEHKNEFN